MTGRAEEGEDAVAEEVGDRPAVALDGVADDRQVAVEQLERRLGRMLGGQRRVAADVGEQRRDVAPIAAERDRERIAERLGRDVLADVPSEQVGEPVLEGLRPQQRAQPGRQLALVERLRQEVVRAGLEAAGLVLGAVERRQQQDRQAGLVGLAAQPLADLDAVEPRHHHVEADEVGCVLRDRRQRRRPVDRLDDVVALPRQQLAEQGQVGRLVVDGQDQRAGRGSRQQVPRDAVDERRELDRLAQVAVEPRRERALAVADHRVGREGDDPQAGDALVGADLRSGPASRPCRAARGPSARGRAAAPGRGRSRPRRSRPSAPGGRRPRAASSRGHGSPACPRPAGSSPSEAVRGAARRAPRAGSAAGPGGPAWSGSRRRVGHVGRVDDRHDDHRDVARLRDRP